jgi:hypothetical protein
MSRLPQGWLHLVAIAAVLGVTAALTPEPWYETDRATYQDIGRHVILQDCSSLHCSRIFVPSILESLPGPSIAKWKTYAVIFNTWAAAEVARFALSVALSPRAALFAMWLSAVGFGSLFTLFDPYSADPLMFALGPLLARWLVEQRYGIAGIVSAIGIFAKEFAAAPLWIAMGASIFARRWADAARTGAVAFAVTVLWMLLQAVLIIGFNNSYGGNPSADLLGGGYIHFWFQKLGLQAGLVALFTEYGPLHVLAPVGLVFAPAELRRIAIAAIPAAAAFLYVQQPDRALWNFHFVVTPLAASILVRVPVAISAAVLITFAAANLRLAAQLLFLPAARYALALSVLLACVAAVLAWRTRADRVPDIPRPAIFDFPRAYRVLFATSALLAVVAGAALADVALHRASEFEYGLNQHGYRGGVARVKTADETRIVLVGGAAVFTPHVRHEHSTAKVLSNYLLQRWRWITAQKPFRKTTVVDLSLPNETAAQLGETLRQYDKLAPDVVVIITGHNDLPGVTLAPGGRRDSVIFRSFGYLPVLSSRLMQQPVVPRAPEVPTSVSWIDAHRGTANDALQPGRCEPPWSDYCEAVADAIDYSLSRGRRVLVASEPYVSREHYAQQRALAGMLADRFASNPNVFYRDLGWIVDPLDATFANDGSTLNARGIEAFADGLATSLLQVVSAS